MKQHGLWRFHYEATQARKMSPDVCWWIDAERAHRFISVMHMGNQGRWAYSIADSVSECARRYARRHGIEYRTARQWNDMCELIMDRMGVKHHATRRSCLINSGVGNPRVYWSEWESECRGCRPIEKWSRRDVVDRAFRIKAAREQRIANDLLFATNEMWQAKRAVADINRSIKAAQAAIKERFS